MHMHQVFEKVLTSSDLRKFVVPKKWFGSWMLPSMCDWSGSTKQVLVFDDLGTKFTFCLKLRRPNLNKGPNFYRKPEFKANGWTEFVAKKGLEAGHTICFRKEDVGDNIKVHVDYRKKKKKDLARSRSNYRV